MNYVDYAVIAVLAVSVIFGLYRGFVSSVVNTGGCLAAFGLSFALYPKLADVIQGNTELVRTLMHYTDATSRIGDLELAVTNVAQMTAEQITQVLEHVDLPAPLDTLLRTNLEQHVYTGLSSVSDYVSQTILTACINVLCFLVCFAALFIVISIVANLLRAVFRFPVLKQLDALCGGVFGLLRGVLICYALFAVVPLVLTVVPFDELSQLIDASTLGKWFDNGNLILYIMNKRL